MPGWQRELVLLQGGSLAAPDAAPRLCSHPAKHNMGGPRGEGARQPPPALPLTPVLAACPGQLWSACRVKVCLHVTLRAGTATGLGLPGRGCFLPGSRPAIAAMPQPTGPGR